MSRFLWKSDPEIARSLKGELRRQRDTLELIASENFTSSAVLEAQGSVLTNKYAEGYPGRRYYGGCEYVDVVENLAIERAKKLFGAEYVNVQPHAGAQANIGVYFALLEVGDTVLGLDLSHGGHLTHGSPVNASGILYNFVPYGVSRETEKINYDEVRKLAKKHRPKMILTGATAYPREIEFSVFREIADEVGAYLVVDMAHIAGLVAAGIHQSPIPHAALVSTTTHKTLRGPRSGMILGKRKYAEKVDKAIFPGLQGGPLMHAIAAKAVALKEALSREFKEYQEKVVKNAKVLAETVAEGGYRLVSGGTDTHLFLVDLTAKEITGEKAQKVLEEAGITVNKNTVPFETLSPFITSGIRVGTPAVTTRGMGEGEMRIIGEMIVKVLDNLDKEEVCKEVRSQVKELCQAFPLYQELEYS